MYFSQLHIFIPPIILQEYISGFSWLGVLLLLLLFIVILLGDEEGKGNPSLKRETEQQ